MTADLAQAMKLIATASPGEHAFEYMRGIARAALAKISTPAEDDRAAFREYLRECDDCAIVPDVGGAFNWAWQRASKAQPKGTAAELTDVQIADAATGIKPYPVELAQVPAAQTVAFARAVIAADRALQAPAPAPEPDERAVFEAWYEGKPAQHMPACWNAWVARAALAATPSPAVGDADARDAARYRWLRDGQGVNWDVLPVDRGNDLAEWRCTFHSPYGMHDDTEDNLDAAVDDAMASSRPPVQGKEQP